MQVSYRSLMLFAAQTIAVCFVPTAMILGYLHAGRFAALRLGIDDFRADYFEGLAWSVVLLVGIAFWPVSSQEKRALMLLWLIRVGVMLGAMLPYEAYYGLDTALYLHRGAILDNPLAFMKFGQGTDNMIAISAVLQSVTDSYSALKVICGYVGLIAVFIFYRGAVVILGRPVIALLFCLGMFPSILFWSSILGKDPVVLFGIAIYCYGAAAFLIRRDWKMLLLVGVGILIAASMRVWLGVILLTPLMATMVLTGRAPLQAKIGFLLLSVPAGIAALKLAGRTFSIESAQDLVERTDVISRSWAKGGSGQEVGVTFVSVFDMLAFIPLGAFAALFRPLPGEVSNAFGVLAGAENACVLALLLLGLWRSGIAWVREPVLFWAVVLLVSWAACYGFASYQNLGTAFRFRVQVAPILVLLALLLAFWPRLIERPEPDPDRAPPVPAE